MVKAGCGRIHDALLSTSDAVEEAGNSIWRACARNRGETGCSLHQLGFSMALAWVKRQPIPHGVVNHQMRVVRA